MARAWAEGSESIGPEHLVAHPKGIAESILRGDPSRAYPYVRRMLLEAGGDLLAIAEQELRDARALLLETEGIDICFSAAAAVAALARAAEDGGVAPDERIVVNLTGCDRRWVENPPAEPVHWLEPHPVHGWAPASDAPEETQAAWQASLEPAIQREP